jgi:hypothetical protein
MPSDEFPQPKPKYEMTQKDLEGLLEVQPDPSVTTKDIINFWENDPHGYVRYIVTPEGWNIILSPYQHNELVKIVGVERGDCLVPDGDLKYDKNEKTLEFIYNWSFDEKLPHIRNAAEQKIKEFLNKKGLNIEKITYIKPRQKSF